MILAIWPSPMNPAVRLVILGVVFTLAGLGVLAMQRQDRSTRPQRSVAHRTSMEKVGSVVASVAAALFLVAGIGSITLGVANLAD